MNNSQIKIYPKLPRKSGVDYDINEAGDFASPVNFTDDVSSDERNVYSPPSSNTRSRRQMQQRAPRHHRIVRETRPVDTDNSLATEEFSEDSTSGVDRVHSKPSVEKSKKTRNKYQFLYDAYMPYWCNYTVCMVVFAVIVCIIAVTYFKNGGSIIANSNTPYQRLSMLIDQLVAGQSNRHNWDVVVPSLQTTLLNQEYPSVILMGYVDETRTAFLEQAVKIATVVEAFHGRSFSYEVLVKTTSLALDRDLRTAFDRILASHHVVILDDISSLSLACRDTIHAHCNGVHSPFLNVVYLLGVNLTTDKIGSTRDIELHLNNVWMDKPNDLQMYILPLLSRIASNSIIVN